MNKCYWVNSYFLINDVKIECCDQLFHYGKDNTKTVTFATFDDLYNFAKSANKFNCWVDKSFWKKRQVYIPVVYDYPICVTEKHFKSAKYVETYQEFTPTTKQAIQYLNMKQMLEYIEELKHGGLK